MLTHAQIWTALDRLAALAGLSPSGLAKKAGLDEDAYATLLDYYVAGRPLEAVPVLEASGILTKDEIAAEHSFSLLLLGGRNQASTGQTATIETHVNGSPFVSFAVPSGFFMHVMEVPASALNATTEYVALAVTAPHAQPVTLEQFDAQPAGVPMFGYDAGWFNLDRLSRLMGLPF